MEATGKSGKELEERRRLLHRVEQLHEFNPMLGHRGVRLGITYPEITEMQARAILEAACQLQKEGLKVVPEIMIPLVGHVKELRDQKVIVDRVAEQVMKEQGVKVKYLVGTMIEVPRGAIVADQIAQEAQFFSFGTNDLTQMTFGFSRDDSGKFLRVYQDKKILEKDPFATHRRRRRGRGACASASRRAARRARISRSASAASTAAIRRRFISSSSAGLDYVSASPYRIPVARLAAAQAALAVKVRRLITFYVHRNGKIRAGRATHRSGVARAPSSGVVVWADVREPDPGRRRGSARAVFKLHPLAVEDALQQRQLPEDRDLQ